MPQRNLKHQSSGWDDDITFLLKRRKGWFSRQEISCLEIHWEETRHGVVVSQACNFIYFFFLHLLPLANSSSEIQVLSTEHGIILYSNVTYYHEEQRVGWLQR